MRAYFGATEGGIKLTAYRDRMLLLFRDFEPTINVTTQRLSDQVRAIQRCHLLDDATLDRLRLESVQTSRVIPIPTQISIIDITQTAVPSYAEGDNVVASTDTRYNEEALWVIKLSTFNAWALVASRALVGISMAGAFTTCPAYTKEISEDSIRGFLGTLVIVGQTSGNLLLYVIGDLLSYDTILWICLALPMIHISFFLLMPESPSYLVKIGRDKDAVKAIAWLRCRREDDLKVQNELDQIKKEQKDDEGRSDFLLKAIFKEKLLFRAFKIAVEIIIAREVCGIVTVSNFAGDIFSTASQGTGLILSPNQQAMLLGVVQVGGALLASSVVETTGRKPLLLGTSVISGVSMFLLASWFLARQYGINAPSMDWLPVATLCLCMFCDASGLQPISVVVVGELFSFKYRGTVMGLTMAVASLADFFQLYFFKPIANSIGEYAIFYLFAGICFMNAVYVFFVVPETKLRSIDKIYEDLKTKKEKENERQMEKDVREITVL